ncbi:hypothetical protein SK128_005791, partial [Halocaridina rubra]
NGELFAAAAFFSFVAMCLYGFTAYQHFMKWRVSGPVFSFFTRSTSSATTTTTTTRTTTTTTAQQKY